MVILTQVKGTQVDLSGSQGDVVKGSPGAKIAAANDEHNGADGEVNIGGD